MGKDKRQHVGGVMHRFMVVYGSHFRYLLTARGVAH
jgi:hypothetical protein